MSGGSSKEQTSGWRELQYVRVSGNQAQDGVRSLFAVLAYPSPREWKKRERFVMAMSALEYERFVQQGGSRRDVPAGIRRMKNQQIVGQLSRGFRKIAVRLSAGSVAYGMVFSGTYIPYDAPAPDGSLGLAVHAPKAVTEALKELLKSKAENTSKPYFESGAALCNAMHRIWALSLPVLHLAVALFPIVEFYTGKSSAPLPRILPCLIAQPTWFGSALRFAETLRTRLHEKVPTFKSGAAICLLPAEDASGAFAAQI
jgi:hypothetical protein